MRNNHGILETFLKSVILFADNYHWPHCDHTETTMCIHRHILSYRPPLVQCTEAGMLRSYNARLICLTTALKKFFAPLLIKHNLPHNCNIYILHINLQLSVLFDLRWLPSQSTWWNDLSRPRCVRLLYNIWQKSTCMLCLLCMLLVILVSGPYYRSSIYSSPWFLPFHYHQIIYLEESFD